VRDLLIALLGIDRSITQCYAFVLAYYHRIIIIIIMDHYEAVRELFHLSENQLISFILDAIIGN
jgi:hypothetical protein